MKMIKTFSREKLYEEIWEISAKQVALKYDLSYSDLLKKCKEFEIPIPNGSYWYRKNTGQDIKRRLRKIKIKILLNLIQLLTLILDTDIMI